MTLETSAGTVEIPDEERQPCEVYQRVTGYYRPVSEFNRGKKAESKQRIPFNTQTIRG